MNEGGKTMTEPVQDKQSPTAEQPERPAPRFPKWAVALILVAIAIAMYASIFLKVSHFGA